MKILYGTTNQAKLEVMKNILSTLSLEIVGLNDLKAAFPYVAETGKTPLENARLKAKAYFDFANMPVFSCDSALYFYDFEDNKQPSVQVRNIGGKTLNDEEMISYYSAIAKDAGGQIKAKYKNAICLILDEHNVFEYVGEDIDGEYFLIVDKPHTTKRKGFPLDSLSVHIETGKYYFDLDEKEKYYSSLGEGFRRFFTWTLK